MWAAGAAEFAGELRAGCAGHLDIGEDDLRGWAGLAEEGERGVAGVCGGDRVTFRFERDGEEFADHWVVVDDQDAERLGRVRHRWRRVSSHAGECQLRACHGRGGVRVVVSRSGEML